MEQNAYEALFIGVNTFVFIIALTAGILLMTNILNMVNFANENVTSGMRGSLAESIGIVEERIYTGTELLTYYRKYVEQLEKAKRKNDMSLLTTKYFVKTNEMGHEESLKNYIEKESINSYYNQKFELIYKGYNNKTEQYVFVMINEE